MLVSYNFAPSLVGRFFLVIRSALLSVFMTFLFLVIGCLVILPILLWFEWCARSGHGMLIQSIPMFIGVFAIFLSFYKGFRDLF